MKNNVKRILAILAAVALIASLIVGAFAAETYTEPERDPSPALYVAQKNANSVVGVITGNRTYDRYTGEPEMNTEAQGSGVVIAEGGYILTNHHVVENGGAFQVLMADGSKVDATVQGSDADMDLAVLKIDDADAIRALTPVEIGSSADLQVGGTVIAIGNPGGEVLAHTVTQGIVSALERSSVSGDNTNRDVDYIQHDAPISSGNSGGGLFNYKGQLVGINTLKYAGGASIYSGSSYEGLGFAIPIDAAYPIAKQLIEKGKVVRPQLGVTVQAFQGGDEPEKDVPPASVCVYSINAGSPAEKAGLKQYDFIYAVNGKRVTTTRELISIIDDFNEGDKVTLTVVRYENVEPYDANANNGYGNNGYNGYGNNGGNYGYGYGNGGYGSSPFDFFFGNGGFGGFGGFGGYGNGGNYGYGNNGNNGRGGYNNNAGFTATGDFEKIDIEITLEIPEDK